MKIDKNFVKSKFSNLSKSFNMNTSKILIDNEEKLKNIFGNDIIYTINSFTQIQKNTNLYLKDVSESINKKYSDFNQEIINHINSTANKYIKAFGLEESTQDQNENNENNILIQKTS